MQDFDRPTEFEERIAVIAQTLRQPRWLGAMAVTSAALVMTLLLANPFAEGPARQSVAERMANRFQAAVNNFELQQAERLKAVNAARLAAIEARDEEARRLEAEIYQSDGLESTAVEVTGTALDQETGLGRAPVSPGAVPVLLGDIFVNLRSGQTLPSLFTGAGADGSQANAINRAIARVYNMRQLRAGQRFDLTFTAAPNGSADSVLSRVSFRIDPQRSIVAKRDAKGNYFAQTVTEPLTQAVVKSSGVINGNIYSSLQRHGLPRDVAAGLTKMFAYSVDFQRDLRRGDKFDLLFERFTNKSGQFVKNGDILFARLTVRGQDRRLYRYKAADGSVDYYDAKGISAQKALMRTPIEGARVSSRFGYRRHPILGYSKLHRGIDFAARIGTPIKAAGDGVISMAQRWAEFGNYVRIRHNASYSTAYGHMSRFAPGITRGKRVRQGDLIGFVGTTGRSTGPHLHYEVLLNGKQVNPENVTVKSFKQLVGKDRVQFLSQLRTLEAKAGLNKAAVARK